MQSCVQFDINEEILHLIEIERVLNKNEVYLTFIKK